MILEVGQMEAHVLDCNEDHDHGDDHDRHFMIMIIIIT